MGQYLYAALILVAVSAVYKFFVNTLYLRELRGLFIRHNKYLNALSEQRPSWDGVATDAVQIRRLFERANISDQTYTSLEPLGYGRVQQNAASMLANIHANDVKIQSDVIAAFHYAEGVYIQRRREAINPIWWIETLLFLPSKVVGYLGAPPASFWGRFANVITWVVGVVGFLTSLPAFSDLQATLSRWFEWARHGLHLYH